MTDSEDAEPEKPETASSEADGAPAEQERRRRQVPGRSNSIPVLLVVVISLLTVGAVISYRSTVETTFETSAITEIVQGELASAQDYPNTHLTWSLRDGSICAGAPKPVRPDQQDSSACSREVYRRFEGEFLLEIKQPAGFKIERIARGEIRLNLVANEADDQAFVLRSLSDGRLSRMEAPAPLAIEVSEQALAGLREPAISIPLLASSLNLGREANIQAIGPQPLLRSGELKVLGKTVMGENIFAAKSVDLQLGDVVLAETGETNDAISALVRAGEETGLEVVFRVKAQTVQVRGLFSEPRVEKITFLDKIQNDPLMTTVWSLLGLLAAGLGIGIFVQSERDDDGSV